MHIHISVCMRICSFVVYKYIFADTCLSVYVNTSTYICIEREREREREGARERQADR